MKNVNNVTSVLRLDKAYCRDFKFSSSGNIPDEMRPEMKIGKQVSTYEDESGFEVELVASIGQEDHFSLDITLVGDFTVEGGLTDSNKYLMDNAVAILFPYLRSQVTLLTTQPGMPPLLLPVINVSKLLKEDLD